MSDPTTSTAESGPPQAETPNHHANGKILNVPNTLCAVRLVGSLVMLYLVWSEQPKTFFWVFVCLLLTDWLDGKLAMLLKQQTTFGARLDSVADAAMYSALLAGMWGFKRDAVTQEAAWLIAAVASYGLSITVGLIKFYRIPSYHTRAAKTCWLLVSLAAIAIFADWRVWPLRVAAVAVMLTNLEATLISLVLHRRRVDVTSIYHAWRDRRTAATPTITEDSAAGDRHSD